MLDGIATRDGIASLDGIALPDGIELLAVISLSKRLGNQHLLDWISLSTLQTTSIFLPEFR